jgi:hypothetical protein
MLKKLIVLAMATMLLASCSGDQAADTTAEKAADQPLEMTIADFNAHAADHVDQVVTVSGTVDHVCKHSGKRLFIFGDDPADRLKIEAGTEVASFDVALEGSEIQVVGKVLEMRMDEAYLDDWAKQEIGDDCTADIQPGQEQAEQVVEAAEAQAENPTMQRIAALRQQLAESEKGYIGFYSLECVSFKEMKQEG